MEVNGQESTSILVTAVPMSLNSAAAVEIKDSSSLKKKTMHGAAVVEIRR